VNVKRVIRSLFVAYAIVSLPLAAGASCPGYTEGNADVRVGTFAGNGRLGVANGSLAQASFIGPFGIATGPDGSVYVADAAAQNIRRIRQGIVENVAGNSSSGASAQQRVGGYVDGPVAIAKFNRPAGLAIGRDGTIYVADSLNHAIRIVKNGVVSTLTTELRRPNALALDDDGRLYVADLGRGLYEISPAGKETRVNSDSNHPDDNLVCGVSAKGSGLSRLLAYTERSSVHLIVGGHDMKLPFDAITEPTFEKGEVGGGCQVLVLSASTVLMSSLVDDSVRFVRFPIDSPVGSSPMVRILAGGHKAGSLSTAGFRDGTAELSLLDAPRGLAVSPNGDVLVADDGNRRVRVIHGVEARGPAEVESSSIKIFTAPQGSYRVALVGNSIIFQNAMWRDSIPGVIERSLIAHQEAIGLKRCPFVEPYRFSAAAVTDLASFISNYYADGEADLVILLLDSANISKEVKALREKTKTPPIQESLADIDPELRQMQTLLSDLRKTLAKSNTEFLVVSIPDGRSISPLENTHSDQLPDILLDFYSDFHPGYETYKMAVVIEKAITTSGVRSMGLLGPMMRFEESPQRVPLYFVEDTHPTIRGAMFIGDAIERQLELWAPWKLHQGR
jgi:DNA-binding beta-propeller fold protein YncE